MIVLAAAFAAGVVTILSPCTLPVVPVILGASLAGRGRRLLWILVGFATTFVGLTVLVASTLSALDLTSSTVRVIAALILVLVGLTLAIPSAAVWAEVRLGPIADRVRPWATSARIPAPLKGLVLGASIGLIWAPCVGPLMAAVIVSAALVGPTVEGLSIAIAYVAGFSLAIGTVALIGRRAAGRAGPEARNGLRRTLGVVMVVSALLVATGLDVPLQASVAAATSPVESATVGAGGDEAVPALDDLGPAPELTGITDWINSQPLTMAGLRGKVVLVHFWTFGCINCIHVQPWVKAWSDRYAADGFVVVGVHTPELSFERDIANVRAAVTNDDVRFPVAFDPDYATWQAFGNHAWPAFYFVGRDGRIRHLHTGEGDYAASEAVIRALLAEPG